MLIAGGLLGPRAGAAQEPSSPPVIASAYCRKVREQAAADAVLLRAPRLLAEAIRFPSSNRIDVGPTVGSNFQARAALSFSPLDFYRGGVVKDVGEADCRAHEAGDRIQGGLEDLADLGRARALRAQVSYLDEHRSEWRALLAKAADQLEARIITMVEYHELRRLTQTLERKSATLEGELERLRARGAAPPDPAALDAFVSAYVTGADDVERSLGRLHAIDTWALKVTGGVIPLPGQRVDWFGLAELSYSLGGVPRGRAETRSAEARADEVRHARYELPARLDEVKRGLGAELSATRRELATVEAELASTDAMGAALGSSGAPNLSHARATLTVERLAAEADRVFLRTLLGALVAAVGDPDVR